jgi:LysR family transcriptional regulator, nitrogen assimilation regulatory protein
MNVQWPPRPTRDARVDIRKLRYFVGIAEAGGFRRAAKNLHVAQPALSNQIRELEAEFGMKLLDRGPLGVSLTEEGQRLLTESREIIERIDRLQSLIERPKGPIQGQVKVGVPTSVSAFLFGPLMARLRERHPEIHVKCTNETPRLMELLAASELDLAIVTRVEPDDIKAPWVVDRLVIEQSYLVGPRGSITAQIDFEALLDLPLVLSPVPHPRRVYMQKLAAARGRTLNVAAEAMAVVGQASFVQQGLGYAVMPYTAATLMTSTGPLEMVPIEDLRSWRLLVRRGDRKATPALLAVREVIVEIFKEGFPPRDDSDPAPLSPTLLVAD